MMVNRLGTAPQEPTCKGVCCHYWIIEPADGPTSKGICQFCGAEKEFDNCGPDLWSPWERNASMTDQVSGPGSSELAPSQKQNNS